MLFVSIFSECLLNFKHLQTKMAMSNNGGFRGLSQKFPHMQWLNIRNEWAAQFLSHYLTILDIKIIFSLVSSQKTY